MKRTKRELSVRAHEYYHKYLEGCNYKGSKEISEESYIAGYKLGRKDQKSEMIQTWHTGTPPEVISDYLITDKRGRLSISTWTNVNSFDSRLTTSWHWKNIKPYLEYEPAAWTELPEKYNRL